MRPLLLIGIALISACSGGSSGHGGNLAWNKDVSAGLGEAKEKRKPLALYFTADW